MTKDKIITTFDGTEAYRSECRYIKGNFYKKDSQCFYVGEQWNRIDNGRIFYDHHTKEWLKNINNAAINYIADAEEDKIVMGEINKSTDKWYYNGFTRILFIFGVTVKIDGMSNSTKKKMKDLFQNPDLAKLTSKFDNTSLYSKVLRYDFSENLPTEYKLLPFVLDALKRRVIFSKFSVFRYINDYLSYSLHNYPFHNYFLDYVSHPLEENNIKKDVYHKWLCRIESINSRSQNLVSTGVYFPEYVYRPNFKEEKVEGTCWTPK